MLGAIQLNAYCTLRNETKTKRNETRFAKRNETAKSKRHKTKTKKTTKKKHHQADSYDS